METNSDKYRQDFMAYLSIYGAIMIWKCTKQED